MVEMKRPSPEELLEEIREEERASGRGKLKIFFGYAAGVGKTYQMLQTAQDEAIKGKDVIAGYVEPHGRPETEALLLGLNILPTKIVEYQGVKLRDFDLDLALAVKPHIIMVDELAHTNAPGLRHAKRWQDVEELLEAGIDVYTTLNVQHLESLNDIITQVTGVQVQETIPDTVFDEADEIEIVDLPQEELIERFKQGKVYVPAQAERAMQNFFKKPNLIALRELALRRTADRINRLSQTARGESKVTKMRPTTERLLVCVGPSPTSATVIRSAKRLASSIRAEWIAVCVETPRTADMSEKSRQQLMRNLRLAEQLGAESITLSGERVADEIVEYAKSRNVTKIVIGKTSEPWWLSFVRKSIVTELVRRSGDIDIYVIRGVEEPFEAAVPKVTKKSEWGGHLRALLAVTVLTGLNYIFFRAGLSEANLVMVYMLGVVLVASRYGRGPSITASIISVLMFDVFFVPPYLKLAVHDAEYFITFGVMLVVALLISTLTSRIRQQAHLWRRREQRIESLYRLSKELAAITGKQQLLTAAAMRLKEVFSGDAAIFMPDESRKLKVSIGGELDFAKNENEVAVAQWVFEHNQIAGSGTETLSSAKALYVPLATHDGVVGVIGISSPQSEQMLAPEQKQLLETFASQIALAIEREILSEQTQKIILKVENEELRK